MGDGAGAFLAALNTQLTESFGPEYRAEIVGSCGYSRGEDKFMGPPEWKKTPASAKGGVIAGVLRDGDWNLAMRWMSENGLEWIFRLALEPRRVLRSRYRRWASSSTRSQSCGQAAFWAGLPIVERHQHPYYLRTYGEAVSGLPGLDAMVNIEPDWRLDLKFKNTTGRWIAVVLIPDGAMVVGADNLMVRGGRSCSVALWRSSFGNGTSPHGRRGGGRSI